MSSIVTEQGLLHYESVGRGQPIILLHGWINSWDVWRDSMIALANQGRYRVYALDFWGFGDSAKGTNNASASFQITSYVEMVHQFMDSLGIQSAPVAGHSMGGTVALQLALTYPDRIKKVAVVGSPVIGFAEPVSEAGGLWLDCSSGVAIPILIRLDHADFAGAGLEKGADDDFSGRAADEHGIFLPQYW